LKKFIADTILITAIKNRISFNKPVPLLISIIIVNFNVKYFLEQCLCSVINASRNIAAEIIVVDNNSTDGSKAFFDGRFGNVRFLWSNVNAGFSKANNLALKHATGKYILFLNPDTILPEDCLEKCLSFFSRQEKCGAMGVKMIDGSGIFLKESKRGFPSPFTAFCKLTGLTALFPTSTLFARYYLGHLDHRQNQEVDVLAGAFMLVKKSVLDLTGGFDERFFMYGEDVDLSYRIQKAGLKNIYFSETTLIHFKGESTKRQSLHYVRLFYGAMGLFVKKHYKPGVALFYNLLIQLAILTKSFYAGITHWIKILIGSKNEEITLEERCLIIADKETFYLITSILKKNNLQPEVIGRINPPNTTEGEALGGVEQLPFLLERQNVNELIVCINGYSAREVIQLMQQLPAGIIYRFHFEGTVSIVGSRDKASSGDCIA